MNAALRSKPPFRDCHGFTRSEIAIVVVMLVALFVLVVPKLQRANQHAKRIGCVSCHKQIGTAFRLFANDYNGRYPFQVLSGTNPPSVLPWGIPSFDTNDASLVWALYQFAGNEISSPYILVCPSDADRARAKDFREGSETTKRSFSHPSKRLNALSFFYGLNANEESPDHLVSGDRNLVAGGADDQPDATLLAGATDLVPLMKSPTGSQLRWGRGLHDRAGNVGFSDGHVEQLTSFKLREAATNSITATGVSNNVLWLPNLPPAKR